MVLPICWRKLGRFGGRAFIVLSVIIKKKNEISFSFSSLNKKHHEGTDRFERSIIEGLPQNIGIDLRND
jgi:hypothetical protein